MTNKIIINNEVFSTESHYTPPYSFGQNGCKPITLRINILTETIYCNRREFKDYDEIYNFLKEKDKSGKWLSHYHNLYDEFDDIYLNNMLKNVRRRYKIFLSKYDFSKN